MGQPRIASRILEAFPSLPFTALGLWMAWNLIACNSNAWISATDFVSIRSAQINITSTAATAIALIVMQSCAPRLAAAFAKPSFSIVGGIIACLGTLSIILIGPYIFGLRFPVAVAQNIFLFSSLIAGMGGAAVAVKSAEWYGTLLPRNAIAKLAYTILLAIAIYFVCIGITVIPIGGNGPGLFQAIIFVILPVFAGCFAALDPNPRIGEQPQASTRRADLPPAFWHMTVVVAALAFSTSVITSYGNMVLPLPVTAGLYPFILLFQGAVVLAFIALAVTYDPRRSNFGRIVNVIMVTAVLIMAIVSFAGSYNPLFYSMMPFVMRVFEFVFLCMLFFIMYQRHISSLLVFGASYGIYAACCSAGWIVGTFALPLIKQTSVLFLICTALSLITLAAAFMLFSEKQFDKLFEAADTVRGPLSSLMSRTFNPPTAAIASRGRFTIAIDVVAEEFALSKREKDVLRQVAMGHDSTRIAEELGISWNTVRTHTRNLYAKLGVHSRQEAADLVDSYKEN